MLRLRHPLLAPVALLVACAAPTRAGAPAEAPATAPAAPPANGPGGALDDDSPETLEELEAQLEALNAELDGAASGGEVTQMDDADEEAGRCTRICDLEAAICDLSSRICSLADEHPGETRYVDACARAEERCTSATQACGACS